MRGIDAPAAGGGATDDGGGAIANESELEAFGRCEYEARSLSPSLRGVLAETAVTGVVRYKWSLLRPLVEFAMEQVGMRQRHAAPCMPLQPRQASPHATPVWCSEHMRMRRVPARCHAPRDHHPRCPSAARTGHRS
jgi:hypothetical protein